MNCKDFLKEQKQGNIISSKGLSHLNNCMNCKDVLLDIENKLEQIGKDKLIETNPFFYTKVKQQLENKQTKPFYSKQFIVRLGNVSSLVITGMFLGLLFFKQFGETKPRQITKESSREIFIENIMNEYFLNVESKSISIFDSALELPNNS